MLEFAGNDLYKDNCLIHIAKITSRLDARRYFRDKYACRPDCIYEWDGRRFRRRASAKFHSSPSDLGHDLGRHPGYKRANVLLSEGKQNFRYFGDKCPIKYNSSYPCLRGLIEGLGQGHRVNFGAELKEELRALMEQAWRIKFPYLEPAIKEVPCRDACSGANEKCAVGEC